MIILIWEFLKWLALKLSPRKRSQEAPKLPDRSEDTTTRSVDEFPQVPEEDRTADEPASEETDHEIEREAPARPPATEDQAPWLQLARQEDGVSEARGRRNNPRVVQYYADSGHPEVKSDDVSWCAAFVGAMLERSGYASSKQLTARSYMTWGKPLDRPKPGAVVVFWRESPRSWKGHVGFYVGEDKKYVFCLGGNQRDAVNVTKFAKSRLLGYRWPSSARVSRTVSAVKLGSAGAALPIGAAGVTAVAEAISPISAEFKILGENLPIFSIVGSVIALLAFGIILYARLDDLTKKGR